MTRCGPQLCLVGINECETETQREFKAIFINRYYFIPVKTSLE
jgi:hypothetical protein